MSAQEVLTPSATTVPLVVDVDGTLIPSDLLHESILQFVAHRPLEIWRLFGWVLGGKAKFKSNIADRADPVSASVPLREETVALIRDAQESGTPVYLASASDRRWVEPIGDRLDVDGVFASDSERNLAGRAKADVLTAAFPQGFDYVGDQPVDLAVWAAARRQYVVSHSSAFDRTVLRRFPDAQIIARPRPSPRGYIKALRTYQWAKNLLVLLPVVAGHKLLDAETMLSAVLAFFAFSFAASSSYLINDLLDLPGDRDHPRKRNRPFASGAIPIAHGPPLALALLVAAIALGALLPAKFLTVLIAYVVLTLSYSVVLKRRLLIDVIVLGGLYTIRVFGGVAAADLRQSQWLLMFSLFLFLSLAVVKRCSELVARRDAGRSAPPGRGYRLEDLHVLVPFAAAAGFGAVLIMALYLSSTDVITLYTHPMRMWLVCPLLLYWIGRVLVLSNRNELHDDPVIFAFTDRVSWLCGAIGVVIIWLSL